MESSQRIEGQYHSGLQSHSEAAVIIIGPAEVRVEQGEQVLKTAPRRGVRISPRVGQIPRHFDFLDGARFSTPHNDQVDLLLRAGKPELAHRLETNLKHAAFAVLILLLGAYLFFQFGISAFARTVAPYVPVKWEERLSRETLQLLEKAGLVGKSKLPAADAKRFKEIASAFSAPVNDRKLKFSLIDGKSLGANAFALPDGTIVMTDKLYKLTKSADQVLAILAHEVGHVHHRHSAVLLIENSIISAFLIVWLSDASAVNLPLAVLTNSFSREHEREADRFAEKTLLEMGRSPLEFAAALEILVNDAKGSSLGHIELLSTHPNSEERISSLRRRYAPAK